MSQGAAGNPTVAMVEAAFRQDALPWRYINMEVRPEDLAGSQGNYELRLEFQRRIDLVIAPAKVNSVLIEEMLIN